MSSGVTSSLSNPPHLTLLGLMAVIAVLALAFTSLPMALSVSLAVTVIGVLAFDALRLPLVTGGGGVRRWLPWMIWSLTLAACPVMIAVMGSLYEHTGPPAFTGPRPWAAVVVDQIFEAHLGVTVVASVAVVVLARGRYRWLAWAAVLAAVAST